MCLFILYTCVCGFGLLLSVGALVNLTVGAASIFHKKQTDSLTEHIYYQSIRQHLSGTHIKHVHTQTHILWRSLRQKERGREGGGSEKATGKGEERKMMRKSKDITTIKPVINDNHPM